ncbi:MAG: hypothetical protein IKC50_07830 [Oscillospiraceae bacterium]|nr:hypothetical protein [Oscillospiraceae bacterium]
MTEGLLFDLRGESDNPSVICCANATSPYTGEASDRLRRRIGIAAEKFCGCVVGTSIARPLSWLSLWESCQRS